MSLCAEKSFSLSVSLASAEKVCLFRKPKVFLLHKPFLYSHPKQLFSTLHLPFALSLTYCPPKNTAVLLIFALNPYAVKLERRTDSNHCRRYPAKLRLCTKPVTWWKPVIFAKTPYRPAIWIVPGVQRFANLWCTFGSFRTSEKHEKRPLCREHRGFANLESTHRNGSFAPQQLKPF